MVAYLKRMDTGYAGGLSREPGPGDIVNETLDSTIDWSTYGFGRPVKYTTAGKIPPIASGATSADIIGFLVRSIPRRAVSYTVLDAYPQINGCAVPVARRGFMTVVLQGASASP